MASLTTLSSLFRSPTSHAHSSSSSSSSSIKCNLPRKPLAVTGTIIRFQSPTRLRLRFNDKQYRNRSLVVRSTFDEVSVLDPPPPPPPSGSGDAKSELIASLKLKLLSAVSGLNRGLAANTDDLQKADAAAKELEAVGGPVDLSVVLDKLQGRWRLLYSSAFSSRTLGGSRPGPPTGRLLPITLGQSAVSGLNRGLAANTDDLQKADTAAKELEAVGGPVDLSVVLDKLQGRWRLLYSSAFSSRTLGGSRPGPPTGRLLPITLGQVFQRIDVLSKDFDNIVELELGAPWPIPPVEATATLAHKFELIGSAKIKIIFQKTTVKTTGNLSQLPPLELPRFPDALRPPSDTRSGSGEFEVTYLDTDTRVTRGDRGELRVFVIA